MNLPNAPIAHEGFFATHFFTVRDQEQSKDFYVRILRGKVTPDQKHLLRALRGRPVILAFYPADWSPVCGDQMALYNEICQSSRNLERSW